MRAAITWTEQKRKLGDLLPWSRNPRQIKQDQARRLLESFNEFGQVETLAIGPDDEVYNGHQRLNVLMRAYGPDFEVDVRVASRPLTEKEREKLTDSRKFDNE
jgi:ParB-like chromosome segregation protein Spo0J